MGGNGNPVGGRAGLRGGIRAKGGRDRGRDAPVTGGIVEIEHERRAPHAGEGIGIGALLEADLATHLRNPAESRAVGDKADNDEQAHQSDQSGQDDAGREAGRRAA